MKHSTSSAAWWDIVCAASVVGIWPRFCEPRLVTTNYVTLKVKDFSANLENLRILQFSDLHLNGFTSASFLKKVQQKALQFDPDIVVFTGDFLCQSSLDQQIKERLKDFLNTFPKGRYGSYAVLGNHDYAEYVSVNAAGEYAVNQEKSSVVHLGIKKFFCKTPSPKAIQTTVRTIPLHQELMDLLAETPFRLLHNVCATVPIQQGGLNIVGLGEYMLGRFNPEAAFSGWDDRFPGIILAHNPDCAPYLSGFPGTVILSGHTHGCQINLPFFRKRFSSMENPKFRYGMLHIDNKWLYINRGLGSLTPLRFFAPPELLCLTLESA